MDHQSIIAEIDSEIVRLQQVRALLATGGTGTGVGNGRKAAKPAKKASKRKPLSAEARKRIADAQKKRWAKQKSAAKKEAKALVKQAVVRGPKPLAKKAAKRVAFKKSGPVKPATEAAPF